MIAMLSHLRTGQRLFLTIPVLTIIVAFFGLRDINRIRTDLMKLHEAALRTVVESAVSTVKSYYDREQAGRLTHEQAVTQAKEALRAIAFDGSNGFIFVHDFAGYTLVNRIRALEGKFRLNAVDADGVRNVQNQIDRAKAGGGITFYRAPAQGDRGAARRMALARPFLPWQWAICSAVYVDDVEQAFWQAARLELAIAAGALLLACAAIFAISRSVSRPMARITASMQALADGNLNVAIPFAGLRNEFGALAAALHVFRTNAAAVSQLRDEQMSAKAKAEAERRAAVLGVADEFETAVAGVLQVVGTAATDMRLASETLTTNASHSSGQAAAANDAAQNASENVNSAAAAAGQLAASIAEIARQVSTSTSIAQEAVAEAAAARGEIDRLSEATRQIGGVIDLIKKIAGQTNLLALNATIEAARAGESGRGFAVVASEVKLLAGQVAHATGEIESKVSGMHQATERSVRGIAHIATIIGQVSHAASAIAAAVEQQDAATRNIAQNVAQAAAGTVAVSNNVAGLGVAVSDTAHAATHVKSASEVVSTNAAEMRSRVGAFLGRLRAA